jgi:uncharacterized caspase-like protein
MTRRHSIGDLSRCAQDSQVERARQALEAVAERRAVGGDIGLIEQFDREIRDRQAEDGEHRSVSWRAAFIPQPTRPILP